ncbi:MAG: hypothetical protein K6G27_02095 [Lachnospiraceae bacterium]|nr:hypothetical protein [Lachnospiraceae bacterium]
MKKKRQTTQINLLIRCVVAVYLIYLAHSIISELDTAPNVRLMAAFAIAFTFAGVLIIAFTIKAYINKDYKDFRDQEDKPADSDTNDGKPVQGEEKEDEVKNVQGIPEDADVTGEPDEAE